MVILSRSDQIELPYLPFKGFSDVISWRNGAIHHKPEFTKAVIHKTKDFKGYVGQAYKRFNFENARLADKMRKSYDS